MKWQVMKIRFLVKRILPRYLWNFLADIYGIYFHGYAKRSYAQEGEDLLLERIIGKQSKGFYVDVGAHHPVRFSNTYLFYKRGWHGINIEPNSRVIGLFKRYRPNDVNLELGISERPGELTYWMFDEPALNSFDRELSEKRDRETAYSMTGTRKVKVDRLDRVLEEYVQPATGIDIMTIDTEGHDLAVLRSNNWERYRPRWLLVESLAREPLDKMKSEQHRFLQEQSYDLYAKTVNTCIYTDKRG
jgi:FkbM family methyltransferase